MTIEDRRTVAAALAEIITLLLRDSNTLNNTIAARLVAGAGVLGAQVTMVGDGLFEQIADRPDDDLAIELTRFSRVLALRQVQNTQIGEMSPRNLQRLRAALEGLLATLAVPENGEAHEQ